MRRVSYALLSVSLMLCAIRVFAADVILLEGDSLAAEERRVVADFLSKLKTELDLTYRLTLTSLVPAEPGTDVVAIVALGERALQQVLQTNSSVPVIAALLRRDSFAQALKQRAKAGIYRGGVTAIYSDPPPAHQVALIQALFGSTASFGIVSLGPLSHAMAEAVAIAEALGMRYQIAEVSLSTPPSAAFKILRTERALLIEKRPETFQWLSLDRLLLTAYDQHNLGIIGYSSGVVNNGALATTYVSLDDTVREVASIIEKLGRTGSDSQPSTAALALPPPAYATEFSVIVNRYVARSLGLEERGVDDLKAAIQKLLDGRR